MVQHLDSPENVFFTSDTHFGDENAMRLSGRPFSSVQEMDDELIRRWNETVPEDSTVFHLGDFGFGKYKRGIEILHSLNGRIYLVLGNHDQQTLCRGHVSQFVRVSQQMILNVAGQKILLNHCPMLFFPNETEGMWQLFGHVHSGPLSRGSDLVRMKYLFPTQYDVGVENNNFRPVSFLEVFERIAAQKKVFRKRRLDGLGIL